jgi:hypothetical protein
MRNLTIMMTLTNLKLTNGLKGAVIKKLMNLFLKAQAQQLTLKKLLTENY